MEKDSASEPAETEGGTHAVPAGPALKAASNALVRLLLGGSLALGAWSLNFNYAASYPVAVLLVVILMIWLFIEYRTRLAAWRDVDDHRWLSLTLIAGTSFALVVFSLLHASMERKHFLNGMIYQTGAAAAVFDDSRLRLDELDGGPYHTRFGSLTASHVDASSTIRMRFPNAGACRDILGHHSPVTSMLSRVEMGGEAFAGWPRKHMIEEHCAEEVVLFYERKETTE